MILKSLCKYVFVVAVLMSFSNLGAQQVQIALEWGDKAVNEQTGKGEKGKFWFEGAYESDLNPEIPEFGMAVPLNGSFEDVEIVLRNPIFETIESEDWLRDIIFPRELSIESELVFIRKAPIVYVRLVPITAAADGTLRRLISADVQVIGKAARVQKNNHSFADHSKLSTGTWFKIPVVRDGIYKMDRNYLEALGVNVSSIDPNAINIYGNDAGMLPYANSEERYDDIQLKKIHFEGGDDGSFDASDYILFYAKGPHSWDYDENSNEYRHTKHLFADEANVFIGIGVDPPARIGQVDPVTGQADFVVTSFDDYRFHEEDFENIIKSGRMMVGEEFGLGGDLSYGGSKFNFENIDTQAEVKIRLRGVTRTIGSSVYSQIQFSSQGNSASMTLQGTSPGSYTIARSKEAVLEFQPMGESLATSVSFNPGSTDSDGWVDYLSINARRMLERTSSQMIFRDMSSVTAGAIAQFEIMNMNSSQFIWDVTDPVNPAEIEYALSGDLARFKAESSELREYVLFNSSNTLSPGIARVVANQDLHSLEQQDMIIVTAAPFRATADKVAAIHRQEGLDVKVVEPQTIYNEFSCGMQDITAIKMFLKMFYDRAGTDTDAMPDYLLLIGDGNYDNSNINPSTSIYLPTFQSAESYSLTQSFVSDDYFGLLDDNESEFGGTVDIGIGRFPVRSVDEVEGIYNKILRYISDNTGVVSGVCQENANSPFGDWKNKVLLIGDDEDNNIHMSQANTLGNIMEEIDEDFIVNKVFLDAYLQEITPGGARYPQAAEEVRREIESGVFLASYTGHGGEVGWAAERVLDVPTIQGFSNRNAMPLLLTATCEFSRFDDPGRTSAGEFILLNPDGGAIALLTTTRLVYAYPNFELSKNFFDVVMRKDQMSYTCSDDGGNFEMDLPNGLRIGDVIRISKNCTVGNEVNKANFSLLGDPALRLSYPELTVVTESIKDANGNILDEIKALQRVTVSGRIEREGQLASDFNGELVPSVFDKTANIQTLANDGNSSYSFSLRKNVIYKGRASVEGGRFEFQFVVPKDISYREGTGKIHYYGLSDDTDAQGSYGDFAVGETDTTAVADEEGPEIDLFLDSESFVDGGLTNESPTLIAKMFDLNGVNTVGNGIGHDITAVLDGNTADPLVLNDYYEADLDSYQSGVVKYNLRGLEEGEHTLRFKVWDIYNNSSVKELKFNVEKKENLALEHVMNYPNPFTSKTEFIFEHNQACSLLDVQVQIFSVSGKLVKTIHKSVDAQSGMGDEILWDGRDDYGDRLGRGVYVYKLRVSNELGEKEEVFEKLVLL